jgi:hypothetical protein
MYIIDIYFFLKEKNRKKREEKDEKQGYKGKIK